MDDTFGRLKKFRKRLKKLSDDDLIVLENSVATLSSAATLGGSSESIFEEENEVDWDLLASAERNISEILSRGDIDWKRREFWHRMNVLGFFDSDENQMDYTQASPPPVLLKRLVEMKSGFVLECVDIMLHDRLVDAWVELDDKSRREGVSFTVPAGAPVSSPPEVQKFFYAAEKHELRMREKSAQETYVVIDDWWKVSRVFLEENSKMRIESMEYPIRIDGNVYHVMSQEANLIIEKFGLEDIREPNTRLETIEKALKE